MKKRKLRRMHVRGLVVVRAERGWLMAELRRRGQWCRLISTLMDCGAFMAELRRREALRQLDELEAHERPVDSLEPGDRIVLRGRALYSMGLIVGELGAAVFTVVPCQCLLCQLGRHVAVEGGRHFARAGVKREGQLCVDELRGEDSDALTSGIQRGIWLAARGGRR